MTSRRHAAAAGIEALAIGIGWLALMSLLTLGVLWIILMLLVPPSDTYRPMLEPDEVRAMIFGNLGVVLGCAAVAAVCEVRRRRASIRLPPAPADRPPA